MSILRLDGKRGVPVYHVVSLLLGIIAASINEGLWYQNLAVGLGTWLVAVTICSIYYALKP